MCSRSFSSYIKYIYIQALRVLDPSVVCQLPKETDRVWVCARDSPLLSFPFIFLFPSRFLYIFWVSLFVFVSILFCSSFVQQTEIYIQRQNDFDHMFDCLEWKLFNCCAKILLLLRKKELKETNRKNTENQSSFVVVVVVFLYLCRLMFVCICFSHQWLVIGAAVVVLLAACRH